MQTATIEQSIPRGLAFFQAAGSPVLKVEIHLLDGSWRTYCKLDRENVAHVTREVGIANCKKCLANYRRYLS